MMEGSAETQYSKGSGRQHTSEVVLMTSAALWTALVAQTTKCRLFIVSSQIEEKERLTMCAVL